MPDTVAEHRKHNSLPELNCYDYNSCFLDLYLKANEDDTYLSGVSMNYQILKKGQLLKLPNQSLFLRVSKGKIWVTRENDNEDYILMEGQSFESNSHGMILIEALEDSTVYYSAQKPETRPEGKQLDAGARSVAMMAEGPLTASAR
jgi:hypothetical protein